MATIRRNADESVIRISKWLGVNEAPDGDQNLLYGEASTMKNFRITQDGALKKRPGYRIMASLSRNYAAVTDESTVTALVTEYGAGTASFFAYPRVFADEDGAVVTDGTPKTLCWENHDELRESYCTVSGQTYRFRRGEKTPRTHVGDRNTIYRGGEWVSDTEVMLVYFCFCDSAQWDGTQWILENPQIIGSDHLVTDEFLSMHYTIPASDNTTAVIWKKRGEPPTETDFLPLYNTSGFVEKLRYSNEGESYVDVDNNPCFELFITGSRFAEEKRKWFFSPVNVISCGTDSTVRGLWSGMVAGQESIYAAACSHLWKIDPTGESWTVQVCGYMDTSDRVHMFSFDEKLYVMNGREYMVWDGERFLAVEGYRPLVSVASLPGGGGTNLEQVNKLNGLRRAWYSPDGSAAVFRLPERNISRVDWVRSTVTGNLIEDYTVNTAAGTVTFLSPPPEGTNTVEIAWTHGTTARVQVTGMRYSELYNGTQDTRVFIYGDGSSKALYSGLDYDGMARADYFPDMNEIVIGDGSTPITAMIRHYSSLLAFKTDGAFSVRYDTLTLDDGTVTAGFYVQTVNKLLGNASPGQAQLVENRPRSLDAGSVIEWKSTSSSGTVTADQRNAQRISRRVDRTMREKDISGALTFYDRLGREYYVFFPDGTVLVNGVDADVWYIYTGLYIKSITEFGGQIVFGDGEGNLCLMSDSCRSDAGVPIETSWESGSMNFGCGNRRKYSAQLWLYIKPEAGGRISVTARTDRKSETAEYACTAPNTGSMPEAEAVRLKAGKFMFYKLLFGDESNDKTATVISAEIRVRGAGLVR